MLRKIRRNYRRLMAFVLSVTMMISNMSVNVGTAFAAEKKEELEIALFMLDGREILDAVRNLENQEEFDLEDLELEAMKKSVGKDYDELLNPEKGKVYELALTIDDEMAPENTELLTLYRAETEEVVFLFVNESREAFDFCVNIDGYETKLVTVNANSVNVNDDEKATEGSGNEKYSGDSAKSSNSEHVDDSANGNDERISESEAQPEADEEEKESSENQDSTDKAEEGTDNRLEEGSEKDAENTLEKDSDKNEAVSDEGKNEGKKTETEKSDSGKSDSGKSDSGKPDSEKSDSEKPNGEKADEVKNDNAASENKDSGKAESRESENKNAGKSGDDKVENSKSEGDKSENSKPESSVSENSKLEDSKSNDSKSDSKDSGKSNSEDSAGKELSISYHPAAFVAVPFEDIQGDNEELTESEPQEEVTEAVSEINPSDEEHKDSNSANVSERFEAAENEAETGEAAIEEESKEETTTAETNTDTTAAETTAAETTTEAAENTVGTTEETLSDEKPSDSDKDDKEILDDEWEIPGKAYDGVTIWETARARAYCVELENVLKIMEFNGEEEVKPEEPPIISAKTYTAETEDAVFTVNVPEGAFEEEVKLNVVKIEAQEQLEKVAEQVDAATGQNKAVLSVLAYDITFISVANDIEVEPLQAVEVNIRLKNLEVPETLTEKKATEVSVVHLPENDEAEVVAEMQSVQATEFEFQAESFSAYVVTYTADAEARTDENSFATLQEAINKVKDGETIYLLDNVIGNFNCAIDKSYTLDMQNPDTKVNHTITGTGNTSVFKITKGAVTLKNGTITGGKASKGGGIYAAGNSEKKKISLTLEKMIISGNTTSSLGGTTALYAKWVNLKIKNCTIENNSSKTSETKTIHLDKSTTEFIGGKIVNNTCDMFGGVYQNGGSALIKGTVIKNNTITSSKKEKSGGYYGYLLDGSVVRMESGAIYNNKCGEEKLDIRFYTQNQSSVNIDIIPADKMTDEAVGGKEYFSGYKYSWKGENWLNKGDIIVSNTDAGIKSSDKGRVPASSGVSYFAQEDPDANPIFVAQVNQNKYLTLQAAIDAVEDGGTIQLIPNNEGTSMPISDAGNIEVKKVFILDLNGRSITSDALVLFNIVQNGKLTLSNSAENSSIDGNSAVNGNINLSDNGELVVNKGVLISNDSLITHNGNELTINDEQTNLTIIHNGQKLIVGGKQTNLNITLEKGKYITIGEGFDADKVNITLNSDVLKGMMEKGSIMEDVVLFANVPEDGLAALSEKILINNLVKDEFTKIEADKNDADNQKIILHKNTPGVYLDGINGSDDNEGLKLTAPVKTFARAKTILEQNKSLDTVYILGTVTIGSENKDETWSLPEGKLIKRGIFSGALVQVKGTLTLEDITIDGSGNVDGKTETIIESTGSLIEVASSGILNIKKGAVLQNNRQKVSNIIEDDGGGAVKNLGTLNMYGGTIQNNITSRSGGGIFARNGKVYIQGGTLNNNTAEGGNGGGAIYMRGSSSHLELGVGSESGCPEFTGNSAAYLGGAICLWDESSGKVFRGKFERNHSASVPTNWAGGGAIYINAGCKMEMKNLYVANNRQIKDGKMGGAGIYTCDTGRTAIFELQGALVADNTINGGEDADINFAGSDKGAIVYVSDYVLGGAEANWINKNDGSKASDLWGTTKYFTIISKVDDKGKNAAKVIAEKEGVVMTDNFSYNNGAAIANNGNLIVGTEEMSLTVEKKWEDMDGEPTAENIPADILVYLIRTLEGHEPEKMLPDERKDGSVILNESNGWRYTWEHLGDSSAIKWSVAEAAINGYNGESSSLKLVTASDDPFWKDIVNNHYIITLTNKPDPDKKTANLEVKKQALSSGSAPDAEFTFTIKLEPEDAEKPFMYPFAYRIKEENQEKPSALKPIYEDNSAIKIKLKAGQAFIIEGIPVGAKYTVTEEFNNYLVYTDGVLNKDAQVSGSIKNEGNSIEYTNVEKTEIKVTKEWEDKGNQDGIRPEAVTAELAKIVDGASVPTGITMELNQGNGWFGIFKDLPKYELDGTLITWTVFEPEVLKGYTSVVKGNEETGFTITNFHTPETVMIAGEKMWDDAGNQDGKRPDHIIVKLYANGKEVSSQVVTAESGWKWSFDGLDRYYAQGKLIAYTFGEAGAADMGYTITELVNPKLVNDDKKNGDEEKRYEGKIVNTYAPEEVDRFVIKKWDDNDNQDGLRSEKITVQLLADGKAVREPLTLNEENGWNDGWKHLPKYDNGEVIVYTVKEISSIHEYSSDTEYNAETRIFTITNTYTPKVKTLKAVKKWEDKNNQDGIRPADGVEVQLMADGIPEGTAVVLNEDNQWNCKWEGLPVYQNGKMIVYSVVENTKLEQYSTIYSYDEGTNTFFIINSHKPTESERPTQPDTPNPPRRPSNPRRDIPNEPTPRTSVPDEPTPQTSIPDEPTPLDTIIEEEVPLAGLPNEPVKEVIIDDEIPLFGLPKTSDNRHMGLWMALFGLSGMGILLTMAGRKKRKEDE